VPKSSIQIIKGHSSKQKILEIPGNIKDIEVLLNAVQK